MKELTNYNPNSDTNITVFSHQLLIGISHKHKQHIFKPEIFNFNLRKADFQQSLNKRKSKLTKHQEDEHITTEKRNFLNEFKNEVDELKILVDNFLPTINPKIFQIQISEHDNFDLDTVVNEPIIFPRFKGENSTEDLIITTINNKKFIIPPFSKFFNYNIKDMKEISTLDEEKFDLIILDPPWRNKYIRRLKKSKTKSTAAYEMLSNDCIKDISIAKYLTLNSLVVIWCTNSYQHQNAILNQFLPAWNLKFLAKWYWVKMNINGRTICSFNNEFGKKQPFETIYIACQENCETNFKELLKYKKNILMSVPSLINSHKPPLFEILKKYLPEKKPNCLEIFARYLQSNCTSIGLEVLKLMDTRLYTIKTNGCNDD